MDRSSPSLGCAHFNQLPYRYLDPPEGADALLELDVTDDVLGPNGSVHAAITMLIADCAGSMAIAAASGRQGATQNVQVHLVSAAKVGPLRASAVLVRASRHSALADVRVVDAGNGDRVVAVAHVSCALFDA